MLFTFYIDGACPNNHSTEDGAGTSGKEHIDGLVSGDGKSQCGEKRKRGKRGERRIAGYGIFLDTGAEVPRELESVGPTSASAAPPASGAIITEGQGTARTSVTTWYGTVPDNVKLTNNRAELTAAIRVLEIIKSGIDLTAERAVM